MEKQQFKYWAFISYSHQDQKIATWLHKALETYTVPGSLVGRKTRVGEIPKKFYPVFRDREELPTSADLSENIRSALHESRFLIVVCSPHSARSLWVNEEVRIFKSIGRESRILCLIIDGEPNAADKPEIAEQECFAPILRYHIDNLGKLSSKRSEPIAADIRPYKDGKRNALLKLISGLLGIDYAILNDREKRRQTKRRLIVALLSSVFVVAAVGAYITVSNLRTERDVLRTRLDKSEYLIRQFLSERPVDSEGRPIIPELTPDLKRQAEQLLAEGNTKQQIMAAIATNDFALADALFAQLEGSTEAERGIEDFELYTLQGDRWYRAGEFDKAIEFFERALALRPDDVQARINVALTYSQARFGNTAENQQHAMEILQDTLKLVPASSYEWAMIQGNIGNIFSNMPIGDQASNLEQAIEAYEASLTVFTRKAYPLDWAKNQTNLGNAWSKMPTGNRAENIQRAIDAYEAALTIRTKENDPWGWANTQANLAIALVLMPQGNKTDNLIRSMSCFEAALSVFTKKDYPVEWARTKNNIGNLWQTMPTGDHKVNLQNAITACEEALTIYTKEDYPFQWAKTTNNIGAIWLQQPTGSKEDIYKALDAFTTSLTVINKDDYPYYWAGIHYNIALACGTLAIEPTYQQTELLRPAIASSKAALSIYTADAFPDEHAKTTNMLQGLKMAYEATNTDKSMPFDAIQPSEYPFEFEPSTTE